jgi:hypothetical protein
VRTVFLFAIFICVVAQTWGQNDSLNQVLTVGGKYGGGIIGGLTAEFRGG